MLADRFGGQHSSNDPVAVALFEDAVLGVLAHRPSVAQALDRVLAADGDFGAAHAVKGLAAIVLARGELLAPAAAALHAARRSLAARGGTAGERCLVESLALAVEGRLGQAVDRLDARLDGAPEDLLAIKVAHSFRFMLGDATGMLRASAAVLPAWSASKAGYGFVLGCHAFALEECGELSAAETTGRAAIDHQPDDAWALHAVAHVHEMQGCIRNGIAWLEAARPVWSRCNNFSFHMAWHLALFYLEQGRHDRVLDLYDAEVRPEPTDDFRDVANAVSLLWRLEQEGVHVGKRWEELRGIARRRRRDTTLMFASLHYLMALVAGGDLLAADELVDEIGMRARDGTGSQPDVAATVGLALAETILGLARHRPVRTALDRLALATPRLGGSHAQRDVFVRTLAMIAADHGDRAGCEQVMAYRGRLRREDHFAGLVTERLRLAEALPRAS